MTTLKDFNSATSKQNIGGSNSILDSIDINVYTKFGVILSICSQDVEWNRNSDVYQGS